MLKECEGRYPVMSKKFGCKASPTMLAGCLGTYTLEHRRRTCSPNLKYFDAMLYNGTITSQTYRTYNSLSFAPDFVISHPRKVFLQSGQLIVSVGPRMCIMKIPYSEDLRAERRCMGRSLGYPGASSRLLCQRGRVSARKPDRTLLVPASFRQMRKGCG